MSNQMTIEELEESMQEKQNELSPEEFDMHVSLFWSYFHLAYCS